MYVVYLVYISVVSYNKNVCVYIYNMSINCLKDYS